MNAITELITEARETLKRPDGADLIYAEELLMRDLADALEQATTERDGLEAAIREALRNAPALGELRWRKVDQMIGILRRALDEQEEPK